MCNSLNDKEEIWKNIPGYEGCYQVSNLGRVKSLARKDAMCHPVIERILSPNLDKTKEIYNISLYKNGKCAITKIYRLVAENFVPNPDNKHRVMHVDHIRTNDVSNNLVWVTHQEVMMHTMSGCKNHKAKLNEDEVIEIKRLLKEKKYTQTEIGKKFKVRPNVIHRIKQRKTWKHIS